MMDNENKDFSKDNFEDNFAPQVPGEETTSGENSSQGQADGSQTQTQTADSHTYSPNPPPSAPNRRWQKLILSAVVFGLIAAVIFQSASFGIETLLNHYYGRSASANSDRVKFVQTYVSGTESDTATDISAIVEASMPAMVSINVVSTVKFSAGIFGGQDQEYKVAGAGSGIIFGKDDASLYIVTNYHVIASADSITVTFADGTSNYAAVKGFDETADLAVLEVRFADMKSSTADAIGIAVLGSSENIKLGSVAIAIGNALGYGQTVTVGYISATNRNVKDQDGIVKTLIQTDAAINPGNSGGALLNMHGEVIGINTLKYTSSNVDNVGFAIPIDEAMTVIGEIMTRVIYTGDDVAYLGITGAAVKDVFYNYASMNIPEGVYVRTVVDGSPAERAGLRPDDIIASFDGKAISTIKMLGQYLTYKTSGDTVELSVYRKQNNGIYQEITLTVTLISKGEAGGSE